MNKSEYLQEVLDSSTKKHIESLMELHLSKKNAVKEALQEEFGTKMVTNPINSGSYAKHTYINQKFDLDFCIPFKYSGFETLKEMWELVFNFLKKYKDNEIVEVRPQKTSIGLFFRAYDKKTKKYEDLDIDVVPGRELKEDDYSETSKIKLYLKPDGSEADSHIQTNIKEHIDFIKGKDKERQVIRLMKVFKLSQDIKIKSFLVELLTIRAFEKNSDNIPAGLWEQLKMVIQFIADNIETIVLNDPANSNNNVTSSLSASEKTALKQRLLSVLSNIESSDEMIRTYFPISLIAVLGTIFTPPRSGSATELGTNNFG